jgi:threonine dehydrogenase-like Zn-dependent dehydrogenase
MLFYRGPFPAGGELESLPGLRTGDYPVKYGYMAVGSTDSGRRVFAFAPHQTVFAASPGDLIDLPDEMSDDDAVFFPSVETAIQIVHDAAPRLAESVLVLGLGVIGSLVSRLLVKSNVRVLAADPVRFRRRLASDAGIETVDPADGDARLQITDMLGGGPDVAINTSGSPGALQLAMDTTRFEGTVVEASWYGSKPVTLDLGAAFHRRRLTIRASQVSNLNPAMAPRWSRERRTTEVLNQISRLTPSQYITHRFPIEKSPQVYDLIAKRPDEVVQVVIETYGVGDGFNRRETAPPGATLSRG